MQSLRQRVYTHLQQRIVTGKLAPGDRLSHRAVAEELGVSFTPVREAIGRLCQEGLVECHPRRGTFVCVPTSRDVADAFDLRMDLEASAMAHVAGRLDQATLRELAGYNRQIEAVYREVLESGTPTWTRQQFRRWMQADGAFHLTVLCAAGNRLAVKVVRDLHLLDRTFAPQNHRPNVALMQRGVRHHQQLLAALRSPDPERSRQLLLEHLSATRDTVVDAIRQGEVDSSESDFGYPETLKRRLTLLDLD